jgi:hypothetical protein
MRTYLTYILYLTCLILLQNNTYACGSSCNEVKTKINAKSQCCSSVKENNSKKDNCCNGNNKKEQKGKCGGKCKNNSCNCVNTFSNFLFSSNFDFYYKRHIQYFEKKQIFCYFNLNTSSGYCLIWTPPNI